MSHDQQQDATDGQDDASALAAAGGMVATAREQRNDEPPVRVTVDEVPDLPFADASFDAGKER